MSSGKTVTPRPAICRPVRTRVRLRTRERSGTRTARCPRLGHCHHSTGPELESMSHRAWLGAVAALCMAICTWVSIASKSGSRRNGPPAIKPEISGFL